MMASPPRETIIEGVAQVRLCVHTTRLPGDVIYADLTTTPQTTTAQTRHAARLAFVQREGPITTTQWLRWRQVFRDTQLEDGRLLSDYGIQNGDSIHIWTPQMIYPESAESADEGSGPGPGKRHRPRKDKSKDNDEDGGAGQGKWRKRQNASRRSGATSAPAGHESESDQAPDASGEADQAPDASGEAEFEVLADQAPDASFTGARKSTGEAKSPSQSQSQSD